MLSLLSYFDFKSILDAFFIYLECLFVYTWLLALKSRTIALKKSGRPVTYDALIAWRAYRKMLYARKILATFLHLCHPQSLSWLSVSTVGCTEFELPVGNKPGRDRIVKHVMEERNMKQLPFHLPSTPLPMMELMKLKLAEVSELCSFVSSSSETWDAKKWGWLRSTQRKICQLNPRHDWGRKAPVRFQAVQKTENHHYGIFRTPSHISWYMMTEGKFSKCLFHHQQDFFHLRVKSYRYLYQHRSHSYGRTNTWPSLTHQQQLQWIPTLT